MILAKEEQAEEISRLVNSAYRGKSSRLGWTTEADYLAGQRVDVEKIKELILTENSFIFVYILNSVQACVHLQKQNNICYLGMLSVHPLVQNTGLGKKILHFAEVWAQKLGLLKMEMTVISIRKELIKWYERNLYHQTGERRPFPYGDERFGKPKRQDLEFIVLVKDLKPKA